MPRKYEVPVVTGCGKTLEETVRSHARIYKALKAFEDEEGPPVAEGGCIPGCITCRDGFHPEKRYGSLEEIKRDLFPRLYEQEVRERLERRQPSEEAVLEELRRATP